MNVPDSSNEKYFSSLSLMWRSFCCRWVAGILVWLTTYAVLTLIGYCEYTCFLQLFNSCHFNRRCFNTRIRELNCLLISFQIKKIKCLTYMFRYALLRSIYTNVCFHKPFLEYTMSDLATWVSEQLLHLALFLVDDLTD